MGESTTELRGGPDRQGSGTFGDRALSPPAAHMLAVAAYSAAALLLFHRAWAAPTARVVGSCCDSAAYVDTLRFTAVAVLHGHNPLYSTMMNSPTGFNVMWQPNVMPLVGILTMPVQFLFGPVVSYDVVVTLGLVFSAWACFVLLRHVVGGFVGPFVGGAFFGFSPVMATHSLGHPQVTLAALVPLMVLLVLEMVVAQRRRWWVAGPALGVLAAAQLLVGEELLADTMIACVTLCVVLAVRFPHRLVEHARRAAPTAAAAFVTFAVLAAAPLAEQLFGPERLSGPIRNTFPNGTNLAALVVPNRYTAEFAPGVTASVSHRLFSGTATGEMVSYLGAPLLAVLVVLVILRRKDVVVQVTTASIVVLAVLSLGAELHVGPHSYDIFMPWRLMHWIPPLRSVEPSRLWQIVDLGVAVLVAVGVTWVLAQRRLVARWGGMAVALLVLVPLLPSFHYYDWSPAVPRFFTTGDVDVIPQSSTVLLVPIPRGGVGDVAGQVWQAESGPRFATVGGSVFVPGPHGRNTLPGGTENSLTRPLDDFAEGIAPADVPDLTAPYWPIDRRLLDRWRVRSIVVGPMTDRGAALAFLERVTGRRPTEVGGVYLWANLQSAWPH